MKPLPVSAWDPSLQHVVDDMHGRPLNIHALMANHPPLLNAWWNLRNYLVNGGDLEQRHCELVILRIAVLTDSWYEWASHVDRGLECGLTLEEIERVKAGPQDTGWSRQEAILLTAVDDLATRQTISGDTLQSLYEFFSEAQIMDTILLHGMYSTIACMISVWGLELDAHILDRLPDICRQEETLTKPHHVLEQKKA